MALIFVCIFSVEKLLFHFIRIFLVCFLQTTTRSLSQTLVFFFLNPLIAT